ncbi:MAG: hypothetical protein R3E39_13505 [Anaerolineae bacterium]
MNSSQPRRLREILAGLFLLVIGLSALVESPVVALLIMAIGGWLMWRQWQKNPNFDISSVLGTQSQPDDDAYLDDRPRQTGAEKVYAHALRAVEQVGLNPDTVQVLPVDVGLMVYRGDDDPVVYRTQPVPDDADYIRPYVQLRLPTKAVGRVKFEIVDGDGQVVFVHEDMHNLERGRNLVTPSAWLPIHDAQAMYNKWQLRISADGTPLATHKFEWSESSTRVMRRHITEDGEISNELRATLAENRLGSMVWTSCSVSRKKTNNPASGADDTPSTRYANNPSSGNKIPFTG